MLVRAFLTAPVPLIGDTIVLRYAENPGIAFGVRLPGQWQLVLILGALILVLLLAVRACTVLSQVAYGLILGGASANVLDRLFDGTVTDYIAVGSFPIFNIPDSCITVGVLLLLAESIGIVRIIQRIA